MAIADLRRTATLQTMTRLRAGAGEALEQPGHEPTTSSEELEGREGYNASFLSGWAIPLPQPTGEAAADVRPLRRGGGGTELKYRNFSVIMSASRRMPMLTAVNVNGAEWRKVPRIDIWSFDGRLNKEDQWGDDLYANNSLDRGHMVRREDPIWGTPDLARQANADTFHFTNSCPQMAGVNQVTWLGLEDYVLQHARADGMKVNVYSGPYFGDGDLEYRGARIPQAFWKVVAIVTEDGRPSATAYEVSQVRELSELEFVFAGYKTFQVSVQHVMEQTGMDFGALLPFDGFSAHERETGERVAEVLNSLESIRV